MNNGSGRVRALLPEKTTNKASSQTGAAEP